MAGSGLTCCAEDQTQLQFKTLKLKDEDSGVAEESLGSKDLDIAQAPLDSTGSIFSPVPCGLGFGHLLCAQI